MLESLQGSSQAGPAGDDVAHEEIMPVAGLGLSESNRDSCLPGASISPKNRIGASFKMTSGHLLVHQKGGVYCSQYSIAWYRLHNIHFHPARQAFIFPNVFKYPIEPH